MAKILGIIQLIVSILLIAMILLQSRGSGLGGTFGGGGEIFQTKRGIEKFLFYATIVFACIFIILSVVMLLLA